MRKITAAIIITLFISSITYAQSWHSTNQVTFGWDAVSMPVDANNVPLPGTIVYDVYTVGYGKDKAMAAKVTRVSVTQAAVSFQYEGKYLLGVQSVRLHDGQELTSTIAWSDDPLAVSSEGIFGALYYVPPGAVKNLRIVK